MTCQISQVKKTEILKIVGKRIKNLRESKGLSQVDLVGKMQGEIDPTNISQTGYTISHVNINNIGDPDDHDLEDDMVGYLQASDKPINGGLFREADFEIKGAEFRFS